MATAIDQAEGNEDAVSRVGQRLPLNVCTAEGLRSQCSLVGGLHMILQHWAKVLCDYGNQVVTELNRH